MSFPLGGKRKTGEEKRRVHATTRGKEAEREIPEVGLGVRAMGVDCRLSMLGMGVGVPESRSFMRGGLRVRFSLRRRASREIKGGGGVGKGRESGRMNVVRGFFPGERHGGADARGG